MLLIKKNNVNLFFGVASVFIVINVYVFSYLIDPYYSSGDPSLYRKVYEELAELSILEGYKYYSTNLDSKELIHFLFSWFFSNLGVDRSVFNASSSAVLAYVAILFFRQRDTSIIIIILIILTNLYFILLYTTTERLKFSLIFFGLSLLNRKKSFKFYILVFLAITSHVQILIFYLAMFFCKAFREFPTFIIRKVVPKELLFIFLFSLLLLLISFEQITLKLSSYYEPRDLSELIKVFSLYVVALYYSKHKTDITIIYFPLFVAIFLLGGERLNMFGYFIFLYFMLPIKKGFNLPVLASSVYFLYWSVNFVVSIIEDGVPATF